MTLGQRIAQKRKELGISQETLGEKLGVSRQAIYKWESDSTLPEVEKLVALSRLFGVSVGWLLGTEEDTAVEELNEKQLKMVEEIVGRYLPAKPKRRRWLLAVGGLALCLLVGNLYQRLEELTRQSQQLQWTVSQVEDSVNRQIGGISDRVENVLKAQNDLTADYGAEFLAADLRAGTITFSLRALPKTYVPGMEALFLVDCGQGQPLEFPAQRGEDGAYQAQATFPLTDTRVLSVVFLSPDGTRATQLMESYGCYLYESLPTVSLSDDLWNDSLIYRKGEARLPVQSHYVYWRTWEGSPFGTELAAQAEEVKVGFFQNETLLFWAESVDQRPANFVGDGWDDARFAYLPDVGFTAAEGDQFSVIAFVKDNYGRVLVGGSSIYELDEEGRLQFAQNQSDPLTWDYPKDADGWPLE